MEGFKLYRLELRTAKGSSTWTIVETKSAEEVLEKIFSMSDGNTVLGIEKGRSFITVGSLESERKETDRNKEIVSMLKGLISELQK